MLNFKSILQPFLSNKQLVFGSAYMIFGSFFTSSINYLYHLVMGRLLDPANYGILASVISLIGLLVLIPSSLGMIITKVISSSQSTNNTGARIKTLNRESLVFAVIFFSIGLVFSPFIAEFLKIQQSLIVVGLIFLLFSFPSIFTKSVLQGLLKFKEAVFCQTFENIARLISAVGLVSIGLTVIGGLIGLIIGTAAGSIVGYIYIRKYLNNLNTDKLDLGLKKTAKATIPFFLLSVSLTSLFSSDLILVKHFYNTFDSGIYAATTFLGRIIYFAASPITAVMFPITVKKFSNNENTSSILIWSLGATVLISIIVTLTYALSPNMIVSMLFGNEYLPASNLLIWYGIFMSFISISYMLLSFELAHGRERVVYVGLLAAVFQVIIIWFFHSNLISIIKISTLIALMLLSYLLVDIYVMESKKKLQK